MSRGGKRQGAGRKRGVPNKLTTELKTAILQAFDNVGGVKYLEKISRTNETAFCALLGKTLPKDLRLGGGLKLKVELVPTERRRTDDSLPGTGAGS